MMSIGFDERVTYILSGLERSGDHFKAWSGASKVLPSPTAGFGVRLAPSYTTSKLPLSPFMAGSGGPWARGRLEQDPICVVGGAQQGGGCGPWFQQPLPLPHSPEY